MMRVAFLCGAPGSSLLLLARELEKTPRVRVVFPWNAAGAIDALARGTAQRDRAWRGPFAPDQRWIEDALGRWTGSLLDALWTREAALASGLELLVLGHYELARHAPRLHSLAPSAHVIVCASDGRSAPNGRIPGRGSESELALAGLAWARSWSAALGPALGLEGLERVHVLRDDELDRDPDAAKARLLAAIGSSAPPAWNGTRPWARERMHGAPLAGFSCSTAARRVLERLGHAPDEPGAFVRNDPELAAEWALELVADAAGLERAATLLAPFERAEPTFALAFARAELAWRRGERDRAVDGWCAALELAPARPEPWERLLALSDEARTLPIAARARAAEVPRIRGALARWLVARGLDAEAAEIVARVEHEAWTDAPSLPGIR
ncbi:MAG: hypothetical protein IPJ77_01090 [Planctomycetes bacterium]|nr:hypothetical protein [Planctomycetota bacterium]